MAQMTSNISNASNTDSALAALGVAKNAPSTFDASFRKATAQSLRLIRVFTSPNPLTLIRAQIRSDEARNLFLELDEAVEKRDPIKLEAAAKRTKQFVFSIRNPTQFQ